MAVTTMIGAKIHRREDPRLVSGEGRYVDDFTRPGTAHMAVVRSPHAHARIKSIDLTAASRAPGGGREVDALDASVCMRTAYHGHMRGAGSREVVNVAAFATDQPGIFPA